jgi:hypothetical protein
MNKAKIIGLTVTALAVVGGIAVFNYVRKPRKNGEGFFSADGEPFGRPKGTRYCAKRQADRSVRFYVNYGGDCPRGTYSASYFGDRSNVPSL